jgi:hypothetical protein
MGMDVIGRNNPDAYFRNNVWWWRPLWDYCIEVAPELCEDVDGGTNDGDGLDEDDSISLAAVLHMEIDAGRTDAYAQAYRAALAELPRHGCKFCDETGIRTDAVGVDAGMPTRELAPELQIITGRTHGWCNACRGEGKLDDIRTSYPFDVENVRKFADFLEECGGFSIC